MHYSVTVCFLSKLFCSSLYNPSKGWNTGKGIVYYHSVSVSLLAFWLPPDSPNIFHPQLSFITWRYKMNPCSKCFLYSLLCTLIWRAYAQQGKLESMSAGTYIICHLCACTCMYSIVARVQSRHVYTCAGCMMFVHFNQNSFEISTTLWSYHYMKAKHQKRIDCYFCTCLWACRGLQSVFSWAN